MCYVTVSYNSDPETGGKSYIVIALAGGGALLAIIFIAIIIVVLLRRCKQKGNRAKDLADHIYDVPIHPQCKHKSMLREKGENNVNLSLSAALAPCDMKLNIAYGCFTPDVGQQRSTDALPSEAKSSEVSLL